MAKKYSSEFVSRIGGKAVRLYRTWYDMHKRCRVGAREASRYFDRGIRVCEQWNDWPTFAVWARTHGYTDELTIDRINNDQGYSPDNCRWVSLAENINNRDPRRVSEAARKAQLKFRQRPFVCVETGEIFLNQQDAMRAKGICATSMSMVLSGQLKTAGGLRWAYVSEVRHP